MGAIGTVGVKICGELVSEYVELAQSVEGKKSIYDML